MTQPKIIPISEVSAVRLAEEFAIWCACYGRNPYDSKLWATSCNGFSLELYGELMTVEQAAEVKAIVWKQRTAQHPLNAPHFRLPRCI